MSTSITVRCGVVSPDRRLVAIIPRLNTRPVTSRHHGPHLSFMLVGIVKDVDFDIAVSR